MLCKDGVRIASDVRRIFGKLLGVAFPASFAISAKAPDKKPLVPHVFHPGRCADPIVVTARLAATAVLSRKA